MIKMKKLMTLVIAAAAAVLAAGMNVQAQVRNTDVSIASPENKLVLLEGKFSQESTQAIIDQVNGYRWEACQKGYPDPRDASRNLTPDDYVPIHWSYSLEEIALTRAAEASVVPDHMRPTGNYWAEMNYNSDVWDSAETLAWHMSSNPISVGLNMWYGEKNAWVNRNSGVVTGHYTSMINPGYLSIGVAAFVTTDKYGHKNASIAGEYSPETGSTSRHALGGIDGQIIEIWEGMLVPRLSVQNLKVGSAGKAELKFLVYLYDEPNPDDAKYVKPIGQVSYTSSNEAIVGVTGDGQIIGRAPGSAVITASCDGYTASAAVEVSSFKATISKSTFTYNGRACKPKVKAVYSDGKKISSRYYRVTYKNNAAIGYAQVIVTGKGKYAGESCAVTYRILPPQGKVSSVKSRRKGEAQISWKKVKTATGYMVQTSLNGRFTDAETTYINNVNQTSMKLTGLTSKKKIYVRVLPYKEMGSETWYGKWSARKYAKVK